MAFFCPSVPSFHHLMNLYEWRLFSSVNSRKCSPHWSLACLLLATSMARPMLIQKGWCCSLLQVDQAFSTIAIVFKRSFSRQQSFICKQPVVFTTSVYPHMLWHKIIWWLTAECTNSLKRSPVIKMMWKFDLGGLFMPKRHYLML